MMGSQRLYDFVDNNPMVEMRSVDSAAPRSFDRTMTAINSAIEVDVTGQTWHIRACTAGSVARWTSSGARVEHGRAISRSPATAGDGSISRIVTH